MRRFISTACLTSLIALASAGASAQQSVETFYHGRTLNIVVGHEVGTGYDLYARTVARYLGRHMPGQPSVITQNMVGAAGLASAIWLANVAPRDGSVIVTFAHTASVDPLLGASGGKLDPSKFNWIGNLDQVTGTCSFSAEAGVQKAEDLFTKEVLVGAAGAGVGGPLSQSARAVRNLLGMKLKLIQGYKGSADVRLAILRGEVNGVCGIPLSTLKTEWRDDFTSGRIKPLLQLGLNKNPELKDIPHVYDFAKTDEDRQVLDLIFGVQANGRPYAAPPGTPPERVAALRSGFAQTIKDPQFLAEAEKLQLDLNPTAGEDVQKLIDRFYAYPPAIVARAKAAVSAD
jgi:tripartite-type tricarboxylate transporter receptor subunit TctC